MDANMKEVILRNFRFYRRWTKSYWVKSKYHPWVRFDDHTIKLMSEIGINLVSDPLLVVEDWRENEKPN